MYKEKENNRNYEKVKQRKEQQGPIEEKSKHFQILN